jgi:Ca2+-binding EF-hand superfamily protein
MEVSDQFRQVFKLIDTNGDGKISTIELCEMLSSLGYNKYTATKEAENMIRELDFNGDGFVDIDEFMFVMKEDNYGKGKEHDHDEYLMDAFLVFDSDKNGLISPKELRSVLINLGCDNCSLRDCKRMIKGVDKNGDGRDPGPRSSGRCFCRSESLRPESVTIAEQRGEFISQLRRSIESWARGEGARRPEGAAVS